MPTYKLNTEKNGIELYFNGKPEEETRNLMKANGFRWGRASMCWYAKQSEKTLAFAKMITNNIMQNESIENKAATTYPEIDIDDISTYTINQELQDREHDSAWVFRKNKRDRTSEMQNVFITWNENTLDAIARTDNPYLIFKMKESLQRFKKRYYTTFVKYLNHKANNPSWAVTGRGGLNATRYNKQIERQDTIMRELINIPEEFEEKLRFYENKNGRDNLQEIKKKVATTEINLDFKTITKEFTYMNFEDKRRTYTYEDYWICKLWGCFRIFKGEKEIHSMRTTDRLDSAKKYVCMIVNELEQKKLDKCQNNHAMQII